MPLHPKQIIIGAMTRYPIYRALPPGATRTYAALRYHGQNSSRADLAQVVEALGRISTRHRSLAFSAIRAAFRTGQDDKVLAALDALQARFPKSAAALEIRSDLDTYHGRYVDALVNAELASRISPARSSATARVVRLSYRCLTQEEANRIAVAAVRRFPYDSDVMWSVARSCISPDQYARIQAAWDDQTVRPGDLVRTVRQLATAATRAGEIEAATDLYRRAIRVVERRGLSRLAPRKLAGRGLTSLAGRNAWSAIEDLNDAFDQAGLPYFFAAGTALGFVREGGPLSADNDIDIGVFAWDWDYDAMVAHFTANPHFDVEPHPLSKKLHLVHRGGSPIDIFRFYEEGGQYWHDGVFVRWHNSPFEVVRQPVRGLPLPLPGDADTYLSENYGDWRTPDSSFDPFTDDAPNVEIVWPEYQRMHFVRRAYKQVAVGDIAAAVHSLKCADEADLASHFGG